MKKLKDPREEALMELVGGAPTEKDRLPKGAGSENLMEDQGDEQEGPETDGKERIEADIDALIEEGVTVDEILSRLSSENRIDDGAE